MAAAAGAAIPVEVMVVVGSSVPPFAASRLAPLEASRAAPVEVMVVEASRMPSVVSQSRGRHWLR
jgi:hypothetical protein